MDSTTFVTNYINYLSRNKTERECVEYAIIQARNAGFKSISELMSIGGLTVGSKVYFVNKDKNFAAFIIGKEYGKSGINLLGAHIDSPRLDVKTNPLYEKDDIAYFDTQYYGGIKKYQWVTRPLAIHGVIFTQIAKRKILSL